MFCKFHIFIEFNKTRTPKNNTVYTALLKDNFNSKRQSHSEAVPRDYAIYSIQKSI